MKPLILTLTNLLKLLILGPATRIRFTLAQLSDPNFDQQDFADNFANQEFGTTPQYQTFYYTGSFPTATASTFYYTGSYPTAFYTSSNQLASSNTLFETTQETRPFFETQTSQSFGQETVGAGFTTGSTNLFTSDDNGQFEQLEKTTQPSVFANVINSQTTDSNDINFNFGQATTFPVELSSDGFNLNQQTTASDGLDFNNNNNFFLPTTQSTNEFDNLNPTISFTEVDYDFGQLGLTTMAPFTFDDFTTGSPFEELTTEINDVEVDSTTFDLNNFNFDSTTTGSNTQKSDDSTTNLNFPVESSTLPSNIDLTEENTTFNINNLSSDVTTESGQFTTNFDTSSQSFEFGSATTNQNVFTTNFDVTTDNFATNGFTTEPKIDLGISSSTGSNSFGTESVTQNSNNFSSQSSVTTDQFGLVTTGQIAGLDSTATVDIQITQVLSNGQIIKKDSKFLLIPPPPPLPPPPMPINVREILAVSKMMMEREKKEREQEGGVVTTDSTGIGSTLDPGLVDLTTRKYLMSHVDVFCFDDIMTYFRPKTMKKIHIFSFFHPITHLFIPYSSPIPTTTASATPTITNSSGLHRPHRKMSQRHVIRSSLFRLGSLIANSGHIIHRRTRFRFHDFRWNF